MRRRGLAWLSIGSLLALGWAVRSRPQPPPPPVTTRTAPPSRQPPRFVVAAALPPASAPVVAAAVPPPPLDPVDVVTGQPTAEQPAPAPDPGPPDARERFFDRLLARDLPDRARADRITEALRGRFAATPEVAVASVTCGSKLCRVELTSPAGTERIFEELPGVAQPGAEMTMQGFPEAAVPKVIAYLSAEGDLPAHPRP
jgi:hypothetical protein